MRESVVYWFSLQFDICLCKENKSFIQFSSNVFVFSLTQ